MTSRQNKSPPAHTPGPWLEEHLGEPGNILITDERGVTIATCWKQPLDPPDWVEGNARLLANAPKLLKALEDAFSSHVAVPPERSIGLTNSCILRQETPSGPHLALPAIGALARRESGGLSS